MNTFHPDAFWLQIYVRNVFLNLGLISNLMHKILVYLLIIHLLKSSTCFEHYPAHLLSFLTGAQDSHLQTVTITEAAYIQL